MSNQSKASQDLADFQYIYDEMVRVAKNYYHSKDHDALKAFLREEPPLSTFCKIPFSKSHSGEVVIGAKAQDRFYVIAERLKAPNKSRVQRDISVTQIVDALKAEFSRLVLESGKELDKDLCKKIVDKALSIAQKDTVAITHFIPIRFFSDYSGETIEFGSIKIVSSESVIKTYYENSCSDDDLETIKFYKERDVAKYLRNFNGVMCIDVPPCERSISGQRAVLAAKLLLGILQLFSGREKSRDIGIFEHVPELRRHFSLFKANSKLGISEHFTFGGREGDIWKDIVGLKIDDLPNIYAATIDKILSPATHEILSNRIIDSILWYSEAITDRSPLSRIVKYVIAIERLVTTDDHSVTEKVEKRASKLIAIFEGERHVWRQKIKDMYTLRSDIVHGTYSVSSSFEQASDYMAEMLARKVIKASTIFFNQLGLGDNISSKELNKRFEEIEGLPDYVPD